MGMKIMLPLLVNSPKLVPFIEVKPKYLSGQLVKHLHPFHLFCTVRVNYQSLLWLIKIICVFLYMEPLTPQDLWIIYSGKVLSRAANHCWSSAEFMIEANNVLQVWFWTAIYLCAGASESWKEVLLNVEQTQNTKSWPWFPIFCRLFPIFCNMLF